MRFRLLAAVLLVCSALSAQTRGDIARIDSLLNSNPEQRRELTLRKASLLKRMYLFDEAAETLTGLLRPDQLDTEVLGEIADCHYQSGNTEDAAQLYGILSQQLPDNLGFRIRYMNLAARAKAYASVIDEGRDLLQRDTLLPALTLMGDAFQKTEQPDSALFYYQEALRRKPRNAAVVGKIADILLGRKAYDETLALADEYLSMDPDNIPVGKVKGLALYLKKQYDPSITAFEHVLEVGDDSYGTHYYLGSWLSGIRAAPGSRRTFLESLANRFLRCRPRPVHRETPLDALLRAGCGSLVQEGPVHVGTRPGRPLHGLSNLRRDGVQPS